MLYRSFSLAFYFEELVFHARYTAFTSTMFRSFFSQFITGFELQESLLCTQENFIFYVDLKELGEFW